MRSWPAKAVEAFPALRPDVLGNGSGEQHWFSAFGFPVSLAGPR
jgi:hypothetical protein